MRKSLSLGFITPLQKIHSYETLEPTNVEEIKVTKTRRKTITQSLHQFFKKEPQQKSPQDSKAKSKTTINTYYSDHQFLKNESEAKLKSLKKSEAAIKNKFSTIDKILEKEEIYYDMKLIEKLVHELKEDLKIMRADLIFSSDKVKEFYEPTLVQYKEKLEKIQKENNL
jgi:hypothetical protein